MLNNLRLSETPNSPAFLEGCCIEAGVTFPTPLPADAAPIIPVGLNDEPDGPEHEVGLPA